ncbi:MAG TPA: FAD-dependent oxidoreductase [Chthoniobacteraceae bacterium]|nr:FAD-dependent oxidoreductase [Chthoniobacteraceae bacterium]
MTTRQVINDYEVVVLGGGAAGVAAAAAAAKAGRRTLLVEAGPFVGGELVSGMPVDGAVNARGEWILGGIGREFFAECERLGGYIGPINDHRLIYYVAFDPEVMKMAVVNVLARYGVDLLLHSFVNEVEAEAGTVRAIRLINKSGITEVRAPIFLDASGDGDLAALAEGEFLKGSEKGEFQPISLMFRLSGVETGRLLDFVHDQPAHFAWGESEAIRAGRTDRELAASLREQGEPAVFLKGNGPLLSEAIERKELFPTALIMIQPTSHARKEVCLNATRVANIDATDTRKLSRTLPLLMDQVIQCTAFMRARVPGFEAAAFAGVAPRLGIRETRRIVGEATLTGEEVLAAKKSDQGVAKGCHHVDIHQDGTGQIRIPVADGGSYDIPWGCLLPRRLRNVLVAGRCASGDREANGTMRVMGSCLGMGQAIGVASALYLEGNFSDTRDISVERLRARLREAGAILEGTH